LSPTRAEHVLRGLAGRIDLILDAGPTTGGIESTVLDLTSQPPRLLRPGLVGLADLEAIIGPIERSPRVKASESTVLPSPGLLARHYAPRTPLECVEGDGSELVEQLLARGLRVGWMTGADIPGATSNSLVRTPMPADPAGYAARLYAVLHQLDDAGLDRIVVSLPTDAEEWAAVRDRLRRAAQ
jgi:L-threonylcarbamoyladenylate synthase